MEKECNTYHLSLHTRGNLYDLYLHNKHWNIIENSYKFLVVLLSYNIIIIHTLLFKIPQYFRPLPIGYNAVLHSYSIYISGAYVFYEDNGMVTTVITSIAGT